MIVEAGTGFGMLALVIGYLPVLYQAFTKRELAISLLDARAGSPSSAAEMLGRHVGMEGKLEQLLERWEDWGGQLLEPQMKLPVLSLYRSQHDNQSWVGSLTTILDACALLLAVAEGGPREQPSEVARVERRDAALNRLVDGGDALPLVRLPVHARHAHTTQSQREDLRPEKILMKI
jgi:hypothetical protein